MPTYAKSASVISRAAFALVASFLLALSFNAQARDTKHHFSIAEALASPAYEGKLNSDIKLYFGDQSHPTPTAEHGEFVTNKKTNAFGKADITACQWVLLSALITLQERAAAEGGNSVVNIRSYYKKNEFSSATEYECHAGAVIAGVALIGDVVTLPN
ncbi:excinuclease ATPase subunit [Haliea sp. E1-2-M8]|uniref:excinuclease ATPase subunit n=1 Tax=Haliea sp. E1-2-M8 TaxID=3064706 RepID=UPI0027181276|nr:excinuclease ATPase subunit [Haliea sp. E1-2-M8]MDO8861114.1 excinuclease ATPase subunit [Haliea sp. E1-2-M8]